MEVFFELPAVPVNSCLLIDTREDALRFPRGDIELAFCSGCGFISNVAFEPERTTYSGRYEETQGFSDTFKRFHSALVTDLIDRLGLKNQRVVEIGCGKGEFLALLCELGNNEGLGFDPSFDDTRGTIPATANARVVKDFFGPQYGREDNDFVCCKMTLEHITATADFVRASRAVLKPSANSQVFFQVPESLRILRECAFEDVYYEHVNYFTEASLKGLFARHGFAIDGVSREYDGQYLAILGHYVGHRTDEELKGEAARLKRQVEGFKTAFAQKIAEWRSIVATRVAQGGRVVIWGSGSKGVSFLSALDNRDAIGHVVDINPNRQGKFMIGSGHPIVGPSDLQSIKPTTVIVMNRVYKPEIAEMLAKLGLTPELLAL